MSTKTRLIQIVIIFTLDAVGQNLNPFFSALIGIGLIAWYWHCFDFGGLTIKQAYLIISAIAAFVVFEIIIKPLIPVTSNQTTLTALTPFAMFSDTCILAPAAEELIFRYFAFAEDDTMWSKILNWIIVPLVFAFFHIRGTANLIAILPYLTISYIFTYLRYKYQLSTSYTAHVLNNFVALVVALIVR